MASVSGRETTAWPLAPTTSRHRAPVVAVLNNKYATDRWPKRWCVKHLLHERHVQNTVSPVLSRFRSIGCENILCTYRTWPAIASKALFAHTSYILPRGVWSGAPASLFASQYLLQCFSVRLRTCVAFAGNFSQTGNLLGKFLDAMPQMLNGPLRDRYSVVNLRHQKKPGRHVTASVPVASIRNEVGLK